MKIQLSPVIISPSMYFPLPLPHIPTKTSTMVNNGLLATDQTDKRLPIQPILPTPSWSNLTADFLHKPGLTSVYAISVANPCSIAFFKMEPSVSAGQWLAVIFFFVRGLWVQAWLAGRVPTSVRGSLALGFGGYLARLESPGGLEGGKALGMDPGSDSPPLAQVGVCLRFYSKWDSRELFYKTVVPCDCVGGIFQSAKSIHLFLAKNHIF